MGQDGSPGVLPDTGTGTGAGLRRGDDNTPLAASQRPEAHIRGPPARRRSLRRVKDSKEELRRTRARGASSGTIDSSTGSSSATPGRSFTVGNINRGIIYLRPVVRAGNQRSRPLPDPFVFPPQTPPDSATLDSIALPARHDADQSWYGSRTPPRTEPELPPLPQDVTVDHGAKRGPLHFTTSPPRAITHVRSRSFSTADEHTVTSHSTEPGTFKVVIERPPFGRPKTADTGSLPLLEVPIPHYRLGTPRFSAQGTAILRSSVYTRASGTEDFRSTLLTPQRATHSFLSSRRRSDVYSPVSINYRTTMEPGALQSASVPSSARVSKAPICPQLYDALTANPDDHAVVRFSSSGDILAATPSRLVAHITSPSFLDYELLSDFFLTFRSFLSARDLAAYLICRLRWAVERQDDFGRIVRVRTFVALRHWILNYFVDDFVPVYSLRTFFCDLVNGLYKDLKARADGGGGDIKIVGELKKCWRRTCALYWDTESGISNDSWDQELLPGGQAGSQASFEENAPDPSTPSTPPRQTGRSAKVDTIGSNPSDQFASRHMDWAQKVQHTPQNSLSSPYVHSQEYEGVQIPLSPSSEYSIQVLSCSLPMRGMNKNDSPNDMPLYPHPVPHPVPTRVTASPQYSAPSKRPNRPSHSHKRSGSFSDALRDHRAPLSISKNAITDAPLSAASKPPGSLIRGGIFPPGSPYIDVKNGGLRHTRSHLELDLVDFGRDESQMRPGHSTNPGMKKIFGSVRRALSSKQPSASSPQLAGTGHQRHPTTSTRTSNPTSVSTASGGVHKRRAARPRPQTRIDLLASKVADNFRVVVKEQTKNEQHPQLQRRHKPDLSGFKFNFEEQEESTNDERLRVPSNEDTQRVHSNITSGSKSILIMDDTGAPELPVMSGALPTPPTDDVSLAKTIPTLHQRVVSIEARLAEDTVSVDQQSALNQSSEVEFSMIRPRTARGSFQHSVVDRRRSLSEGREQLHSFRRRGSTKASLARSTSLRRHASFNSGLSKHNATASIATFRTMSSENDPFFLDHQPTGSQEPARQLRRRPGGDLRAVDNVHDLEHIQRPHSTGSISNQTHSVTNSVILRSDPHMELANEKDIQHEEDVPSEEVPEKKPISLVATHSSQPNLRPSFEVEVAKLAALPDDHEDDGGIESALMKLEGRYEKKSPDPSPRATVVPEGYQTVASPTGSTKLPNVTSDQDSTHTGIQPSAVDRPFSSSDAEDQNIYETSGVISNRRVQDVQSGVDSEDSYSSIPLLDRGLSDIATSPRSRTLDSMRSSAKPPPLHTNGSPTWQDRQPATKFTSPNSSIEYVIETDSMKRIPTNGTLPGSSPPRESFLLDDDEDLSDLSDDGSAMRTQSDGTSHGVRSFFDDEPATMENEKDSMPMHPMRHPPTPPLTANRLNERSLQVGTTAFERGLPTPGLTPTSRLNNPAFGSGNHPLSPPTEPAIELQELKKSNSPPSPAHLPFVLAYDSETIAQQFTIVEKDALDEIDWKELIELRWKQSSPQIRDWVQYLRTQDARGVDVVIARFNLVVKWTVSECLLTEAVEERARCIVKFIHIASHARRLRNYATMYQITIALLSSDISRLKQTWALIPAAELQTMKNLEALVQPLRNFHNLRVEMETATVEEGCIPFIGIYTRDLIYNAQKPAFIEAPPVDGERLVNFERHHTAAMIVKSLLRLLEASSKYTFKAEPNIISKCLWLAALGDEELTALSHKYE